MPPADATGVFFTGVGAAQEEQKGWNFRDRRISDLPEELLQLPRSPDDEDQPPAATSCRRRTASAANKSTQSMPSQDLEGLS